MRPAALRLAGRPFGAPAVRFARDMEIEPPGETKVRLAEELGAGPASANTARVCFGYATSHPLASLEGANVLLLK
ncbi:hypothetical protein PI124_g5338 [Phytophthora idaei]|nr:hypothetical protein PI125_g5530 [Phytophthora idaei]KAG3153566.1 hypothetical protein PI126_g10011 [Phytophthora idaei]KAG3250014.1 hypothetical protein PI124_g5338 [Phytophthora idaei]